MGLASPVSQVGEEGRDLISAFDTVIPRDRVFFHLRVSDSTSIEGAQVARKLLLVGQGGINIHNPDLCSSHVITRGSSDTYWQQKDTYSTQSSGELLI